VKYSGKSFQGRPCANSAVGAVQISRSDKLWR